MLLKLAALGAIGYVGYKYVQKNGGMSALMGEGSSDIRRSGRSDDSDPHTAVAGDNAALVHGSGAPLPAL